MKLLVEELREQHFELGVVLPHLPVGKKLLFLLSCVTWLKLTKTD